MQKPAFENWSPVVLAIILISPLFTLPRPVNISSITWRVELLFSVFLVVLLLLRKRANTEAPGTGLPHKLAFLFLCGFLVWSALSTFWSISATSAVHHTLVWASYAIVLVFTYTFALSPRGLSKIHYLFAAVTLLIGAVACFDFLTIQDFAIQEGSLRIRYAKFAEMLIALAPLLFAVPIVAKRKRGLVPGLLIASLAWCTVMLSLSKGAFLAGTIGLALGFLLIAVFKSKLRQRTAMVAGVWLAVTLVFQFGFTYLTSIPSTAEYISGSHQSGTSTYDMRIFTWKVAAQMFVSDPILGVGGDNFGLQVNKARRAYAESNPNDIDVAIGEDYIFERAHNEFIQIACELGSVGLILFIGFVGTIVFTLLREIYRRGKHLSPFFYGAIGGMAAFTASSMVSSFSFRAFQNGLIFMIVLGFAASYLMSRDQLEETADSPTVSAAKMKWFAISLAAMLAVFSLTKAASQYVVYFGERASDIENAVRYFDLAARLDPDNPGAELSSAATLATKERWSEANPHYRSAIDKGYGVSLVYSSFATAQEKAGELRSAEQTLQECAAVFPRSTFIRVRLATVLEQLGRQNDADEQLAISRAIDARQTNGWYSVIKDGILKAHLNSVAEPDRYAKPPELLPAGAINAYNDDKIRVD